MALFGRDRIIPAVPYERDCHITVHKTVTERRAPTDESVRLLREMEYAAEQKLISSVRVGDTTFEAVIHEYISPADGHSHTWRAIFSLNGKNHTVSYTGAAPGDINASPDAWVLGLRDAIAKEIAGQILLATLKPTR
jgi:hypothetical protein